ncbi:MAG: hypothetical protein EAS51_12550 [Microbacteriaceae bacterium]|nr:MAG: hypothetical protein EAS51_12550 [Microbacteriaceae bacterium]
MRNITTGRGRMAALAVIGAIALILGTPLAASAADKDSDALQARIDAVLAEYPGGVQIAANEIAWDEGAVVLTLDAPGSAFGVLDVGSCTAGHYCAYNGYSLSGSKLSFSSCATPQPTGIIGTVRSVANARTSGSVYALNSGGGILATIGANDSLPIAPGGITDLSC